MAYINHWIPAFAGMTKGWLLAFAAMMKGDFWLLLEERTGSVIDFFILKIDFYYQLVQPGRFCTGGRDAALGVR